MHKSQLFGYFSIAFLVGVFAGSLVVDPTRFTTTLLILGGIAIAVFGYRKSAIKNKYGVVVGVSILFAAIGVFRYGLVSLDNSTLATFADVQVGAKAVPVQLVGYIDY